MVQLQRPLHKFLDVQDQPLTIKRPIFGPQGAHGNQEMTMATIEEDQGEVIAEEVEDPIIPTEDLIILIFILIVILW